MTIKIYNLLIGAISIENSGAAWGTGLPKILNRCKEYGLPEPLFEEFGDGFKVTLFRKVSNAQEKMSEVDDAQIKIARSQYENEKNERSLSKVLREVLPISEYNKVEKVIHYLEINRSITPKIAEEITGKSAPTVRRYLKMLVSTGYVYAEGNTTNIRYIIKK